MFCLNWIKIWSNPLDVPPQKYKKWTSPNILLTFQQRDQQVHLSNQRNFKHQTLFTWSRDQSLYFRPKIEVLRKLLKCVACSPDNLNFSNYLYSHISQMVKVLLQKNSREIAIQIFFAKSDRLSNLISSKQLFSFFIK